MAKKRQTTGSSPAGRKSSANPSAARRAATRKTVARKTVARKSGQRRDGGGGSRRRPKTSRRRRWPKILAVLLVLVAAILAGLIWPFWQLSGQFGPQTGEQPSRLYGRPQVLRSGQAASAKAVVEALRESGYRQLEGSGSEVSASMAPGTFRVVGDRVEVFRRRFPTSDGMKGGDRLRLSFKGGTLETIETGDGYLTSARLDPPLIASYYGPDLRERRPIGLDELPEELIFCVLAAEDAYFLEHSGVSLIGVLRAAWVNLRAKEVRQGGSTLTQQLVKNIYLTPQRTYIRKLQEALLAVFLELRYEKRDILQAYLNVIYWGRSGRVDLMGIGAAAWGYFGKHPSQLDLSEAAVLAGMIQSPANLSPLTHPEAALERRDVVLGRLAQLAWLPADRLEQAAAERTVAARKPLVTRHAPFFAAAVEDEARRRFGIESLADTGYVLHSTLSAEDQRAAEEALRWGVDALEKGWEKGRKTKAPLEAALVSIDPVTGSILAYVGGRDFGRSQFDRVTQAQRQAGSAFKPIVYAAAFADRVATPATFLDDTPLTVRVADRTWSPKNSNDKYSGQISARGALELSLNVPTARLAMDVGLERVIALAHAMGIEGDLDPYPALALGAMEVTPIEMATAYATLASGGVRPSLHRLIKVTDRRGDEVAGRPLPPPERALEANVAFVVNKILQGVLDRGTGRSARDQGIKDPLAGKTGTTNSRRDSWFAGYSKERITLVWVGYDDNSSTRLSGARAALPIWSRFTYKVRPAGGYSDFQQPPGVLEALVDPATAGLATDRCLTTITEVFLSDFAPAHLCPQHSGWRARPLEQPGSIEPERKRHPFKRWLQMLKGKKKKNRGVI